MPGLLEQAACFSKSIDQTSLSIWRCLHAVNGRLQSWTGHAETNLVTAFFHDIVQIITACFYRVLESQQDIVTEGLLLERRRIFPYVDYQDIMNGIDPAAKVYRPVPPSVPWKQRLVSLGSRMRIGSRHIGLAKPAIQIGRICKASYRLDMDLHCCVYLAEPDAQWKVAREMLEAELNKWLPPMLVPGLLEIIRRHVSAHLSSKPAALELDALVTGTTSNRYLRFKALAARTHGIPCITVLHGEADGIRDEPIFGYGEMGVANVILGYGANARWFQESDYSKPLLGNIRYITGNSNLALSLFRADKDIELLGDWRNRCCWYVPTLFSGFETYGPFRVWSDTHYAAWQQRLTRTFPKLIIKRHPKTKLDIGVSDRCERVETRPLTEVLAQADVWVFDYLSSAFSTAAATTKPIIFLDLGMQRVTSVALDAIKERCVYVDLAQVGEDDLPNAIDAGASERKVNHYTPQFSLCGNNESREECLLRWLREL